ncbi:MAG: polysaccharide deacetylase family protein [Polyangiaceae bacterium]|nr:polysaccharide deacetylase family protein [Polyangiaceae bacterium]
MIKRHLAATCLSAVPHPVYRAARTLVRGRWITVLCYHRILDRPTDFPFDDDVVSASAQQFERHLRFISKHYDVIDFRKLRDLLDSGRRFPKNALIITFDDGYVDNYQVAYPLLRRFGFTAVMFVTAGIVGTTQLFWWDKIASIVKRTSVVRATLDGAAPMQIDLDAYPNRQAAVCALLARAKRLSEHSKNAFIEELSRRLDVEVGDRGPRNTMTWDEVRELSAGGIEIGAHSVTHPLFSDRDAETIAREIKESKEIVERMIGTEVVTFGAPGRGTMTPEEDARLKALVRSTVKESGYSFSTLYRSGLAYEKGFDPLAVQRIGIEAGDSDPVFQAKLGVPESAHYLL